MPKTVSESTIYPVSARCGTNSKESSFSVLHKQVGQLTWKYQLYRLTILLVSVAGDLILSTLTEVCTLRVHNTKLNLP